ncbi:MULTISPECIES: rRNA maturation RNase YbeY [Allobacillus]|uniref:Endoribonuclease YbeY n=1 Tax=Allobacillus halotolerans TaxID=570278 RepID=A0ABS6GKJ2_9BACI|nr:MULTISPECIES: rRNA maturation RNase YbeY [Allobacillus]MBU6079697.1 rRNA maturation RNase YbeY [Allobacillus halotolerans]TSJ68225.1 rRNA maturation RNase YbeY [Allobacillus sp. SKP2-8]
MIIDINDETNQLEQNQLELLEKLLDYAREKEEIENDAELSITIVDNETIQEINKQYRDKDQPTDVISFALEEHGEEEIEIRGDNLPRHLGDIIISIEKVNEQANEYGHSFNRELGFLAVHGFLHLLGYDHMTTEEEKEMMERQDHLLDDFGLTRHEK